MFFKILRFLSIFCHLPVIIFAERSSQWSFTISHWPSLSWISPLSQPVKEAPLSAMQKGGASKKEKYIFSIRIVTFPSAPVGFFIIWQKHYQYLVICCNILYFPLLFPHYGKILPSDFKRIFLNEIMSVQSEWWSINFFWADLLYIHIILDHLTFYQ